MNADSEQMRVVYEGAVKLNPADVEAVQYLAVWHLERHSFQQARKYFGHLATLKQFDADVWLCLSVCCAMAEEFTECITALKTAQNLIPSSEEDVRVKFCRALMSEKRKDFTVAMEGYVNCLNQCAATAQAHAAEEAAGRAASETGHTPWGEASTTSASSASTHKLGFMKELRGEVMLRIAVLKKEMGAIDQSMQMCNTITSEPFGDCIRANALCLKGLLHEMRAEFPASEVVYRSVLQITSGHSTALERLGRVYLRYRETIPAAVQCFFKFVETNPSNHVAWYLLGRCYMATSQYSDACEAYNRAVNLNPNDPQVWCSLGVLYYAFGQYKEALGMLARALKLDSTMADAWYNVGALYDMCDQPEDAQQAYVKAKENGLADRFARAGMGLNPLAMQSLQYINSNASGTGGGGSSSSAGAAAQGSAGTAGEAGKGGVSNAGMAAGSGSSGAPAGSSGKSAAAARKQQLSQQQLLHQQQALQHQALQQHQLQQNQLKHLQAHQQAMYHQTQQQQQGRSAMHFQQQHGVDHAAQAQLHQHMQLQQHLQYQQQLQNQAALHYQQQHQQQHQHQHGQELSHSSPGQSSVAPLSFAELQNSFHLDHAPSSGRNGDHGATSGNGGNGGGGYGSSGQGGGGQNQY